MNKLKLFTLAVAAVFAGSAMAAPTFNMPTTTLTLPHFSADNWGGKVVTPYFEKGDTIILSAYESYQSISTQSWISTNGSGSSSITDIKNLWTAPAPFCGGQAYGTTQQDDKGNNKYAYASTKTESERVYSYRVTNCTDAMAYVASGSNQKRTVYIEAYEISTDGTASTTYVKQAYMESNTAAIIKVEGLEATKEYVIVVYSTGTGTKGDSKGNSNFYEIAFVAAHPALNDATLRSITVDGEALEGFSAERLEYNMELPFNTSDVPVVAATPTSWAANVNVVQASAIPGTATITVTAEDKTTQKTYTINFSTASAPSTDATLSALMINGNAVSGFKADSLDYAWEMAYAKTPTLPKVTATKNDEHATIAITDITKLPGTATVVVTAQDGVTKKTYTVAFTMAATPKILSAVVFSNGAKGAAVESNGEVKFPYIAGTAVPTIDSIAVNSYSTFVKAEDESKITVTATNGDESVLEYTVTGVALTPAVLADNVEVTFTGTEEYVFAPYGWDSGKGWKFAKNVEDDSNRRVSEGRTRLYMALPAAKEVVLYSGSASGRDIKVYVNNVLNENVTNSGEAANPITIALNSTSANLLAIESNQKNGDGGFIKIKLVPASHETGIDAESVEAKVVKRVVNGQLVIEKDGVLYNALGNIVK